MPQWTACATRAPGCLPACLQAGALEGGGLRPLLSDARVADLFVKLLCQFEPGSVLPFLQSHDSYSVDESLRHCLAHGAQAGAAFLLERRGDVQSALRIYVEVRAPCFPNNGFPPLPRHFCLLSACCVEERSCVQACRNVRPW